MKPALVIVGASYAGLGVAAAARQNGYDGQIHLLSDEVDLPYQRPFLSKSFLLEELDPLDLLLKGEKFYGDLSIDLVLSERATRLALKDRAVELASGGRLQASAIVLATGASARSLPNFSPALYEQLRTLADARALKTKLERADTVIVVGGGLIGLETAAAARKLGKAVTVVEAGPRLLGRVVSPEVARRIQQTHEAHGVVFEFGLPLALRSDGEGRELTLSDGRRLHGDLVLAGVGSTPNVSLAEQAGLTVSNGIVTDVNGRSSVPEVFAAGDCARAFSIWAGEWVRLESVQSAADQGKTVGGALVAVPPATHGVPRFSSVQFESQLQVVGMPGLGVSSHLVVAEAKGRLSEIYEKEGRVVGVVSLDDPWLHNRARKAFQLDPLGVRLGSLLDSVPV